MAKYLRAWFIAVFAIPYFMFGTTALFYFGIGTFLGINKNNLFDLSQRVKIPSFITNIVLVLIATHLNHLPVHDYLLRAFIPFGIISAFCIADSLNDKWAGLLSRLSISVFFVYAIHEIFIRKWTNGMFLRIFGNGVKGSVISYFGVPIVVYIVSNCLFFILKKIAPKPLTFLCGGRI